MYCKNCGEQIDDKAVICPKCGVEVKSGNIGSMNDAPSMGFAVLCFFFPVPVKGALLRKRCVDRSLRQRSFYDFIYGHLFLCNCRSALFGRRWLCGRIK